MRSKTMGAEVWTLFLPPTWPEVSQATGLDSSSAGLSQQHPHSTSNPSYNSHPTDPAWQVNPSCNPNFHPCQVGLETQSHFPSWQLPLSLAKRCSHHNRLESFVRSLLPQTRGQQRIQRRKFRMILQSQNQKPCWPPQINNKWKNYKYRHAQGSIQFTFLLSATL